MVLHWCSDAKELGMSRSPRSDIVDPHSVQMFHCRSRCVRRAFLCGEDHYSGKNYDHRRQWIEDKQIDLAKYFSLDIVAVSIMSNHMHHVLRTRPDLVRKMSNKEVARRWLGICPKRRNDDGTACEPTDDEIRDLCKQKNKLKQLRERLSSISWFMRVLKQSIARRANLEDEVDGRFWVRPSYCLHSPRLKELNTLINAVCTDFASCYQFCV